MRIIYKPLGTDARLPVCSGFRLVKVERLVRPTAVPAARSVWELVGAASARRSAGTASAMCHATLAIVAPTRPRHALVTVDCSCLATALISCLV